MSDDLQRELREVQEHFRLPGIGLVEKDLHVIRAIAALASVEAAPFQLVFGGGTALARAHKLIRRMSEDIDFKIVPLPAAPITRSTLHKALSALRGKVTLALQSAGFEFDPEDPAHTKSRNESRYTIWQLPFAGLEEAAEGLRPTVQVELTYAPLRLAPITLPVSSFVAEAYSRPAEIASMPCVSVTETAAEKVVALTRRVAMELAGLSRNPDPTLVRHIYDLHQMTGFIDQKQVTDLARLIAEADGEEFRNQYPAYASDIAGETQKAMAALQDDPAYRKRYDDFVQAMAYGDRPDFDTALSKVVDLAKQIA